MMRVMLQLVEGTGHGPENTLGQPVFVVLGDRDVALIHRHRAVSTIDWAAACLNLDLDAVRGDDPGVLPGTEGMIVQLSTTPNLPERYDLERGREGKCGTTCDVCLREMASGDSCLHMEIRFKGDDTWYPSTKMGAEPEPYRGVGAVNCPDCNVGPGEQHHPGCDWERCAKCGRTAVNCTDHIIEEVRLCVAE